MRFFVFRTGRLARRYARQHRHDGLGGIAIRCIRCAPMEYEASPQPSIPDYTSGPPLSDVPMRLADLQARNMDARYDSPPPAPLPWE